LRIMEWNQTTFNVESSFANAQQATLRLDLDGTDLTTPQQVVIPPGASSVVVDVSVPAASVALWYAALDVFEIHFFFLGGPLDMATSRSTRSRRRSRLLPSVLMLLWRSNGAWVSARWSSCRSPTKTRSARAFTLGSTGCRSGPRGPTGSRSTRSSRASPMT